MFGLVTGEWVLKQQISDGGMPLDIYGRMDIRYNNG